ncbi:hypothetical protein MLD38_023813 [Melastoma candidum]|uniref:Uncharacterized protein n=1 Tax=Melastoma candidum TaxID=119954 RepID=A0ACB9NS40_9MYRT|nr:hypothetical protein MLD38_023813 [Melastoma candidum]
MAIAFSAFVFAASFLFLHVTGGRELVAANKEKLTAPSFESKARIEAEAAYIFRAADTSISMRRIQRRLFILEGTNEGKDLAADRKNKEPRETNMKVRSEALESTGSTLMETSLVSANNKGQSPPASISWRVPERKPPRSGKMPGFDSDYCQPRTHPPTHN